MNSDTIEIFCNITLTSINKVQSKSKKLKKISKNLKNLIESDLKECPELKIKIFKEEKEEEKKPEFKIVAPIIGFQHYFEDFKLLNSKQIINNVVDYEGKNTPSTIDDNEELKQIDSSDFNDDD